MNDTNETINDNLEDQSIEDQGSNDIDEDGQQSDQSVEDIKKELERLRSENKSHVLKDRKSKLEKLGYTDLELLKLETLNDDQFNSFIKFMTLNKKENENIEQYTPTVSTIGITNQTQKIKKESFLD